MVYFTGRLEQTAGKTGAFVYAPLIGFILSHYGPAAGFLIFSGADPQIQHGMRDAQLEKLHGYVVRCSVFTNHDDRCSPVTKPRASFNF